MKKTLNIILIALFTAIGITASAQSANQYGTQFDNRGFENWDGLGGGSNDTEPYHWHSTPTATGTWASLIPKSGVIGSDSHTRPGSIGSKSAKVTAKKVLTVIANGNITNGRMNAGSTSASNANNYNYTNRSGNNGVHCTPLNGYVPDSITVWVCLYTGNANHKGKIYSAIHGDSDFRYISNASISSNSELVKSACKHFNRTTSSTSTYTWQRLSVPYGYNDEATSNPATGTCTDPRYVFVVVTTNTTAGQGTAGDFLLVDDILLIYNPTLTTGTIAQNEYNVGQSITIPFTLTGTMSPDNLNKPSNEVIAELSDANGNFGAYPVELGRVTTDVTGSITTTIPNNIPSGTGYRIRVRSTNYPMTANDNGVNIKINGYSSFYASVTPNGSGTLNLANGTNYGDSSEGNFIDGTTVSISATANDGYTFVKWTENGNQVSTNANYSFTMNGSKTLVANFDEAITITAVANPTNGGSVSGGGYYSEGATCTLTATPNTGYVFVNWTKNGTEVSTNASYSFTVTENATYTANFIAQHVITVNASPSNGGTVTGGGSYNAGTTVTLTATPNSGYAFVNWTKGGTEVSTNATYSFTATESATYTANFIAQYVITVNANPTNGGTVTGGGTYNAGSQATLTATPNSGYVFKNWTKNGNIVSTNATYTIASVDESATYTANFATEHTITVEANPTDGGTVSGGGTYEDGTSVTLTATANANFTFLNWTKGGNVVSTSPIFNITVSEDATYTANFARTYRITVTNSEGGTATGGGTYAVNTTVTLTATANDGFAFINWTKDNVEVSTEPSFDITVTEDATYKANFTRQYTITATANPEEGGTVTGGGTYNAGEEVTLTATANTGFVFVNWTKNGSVVSSYNQLIFDASENAEYTANFVHRYTITVISTEGGTATGGGDYNEGTQVTLTATANTADGYGFVNWTNENDEVVSTEATFSFEATGNATYIANFAKEFTITVNNTEGGTATGGGTFFEYTEITLTATPNEGYVFTGWEKDGQPINAAASFNITVNEETSGTYTANFEIATYTITVEANPAETGTVTGGGTYDHGTQITLNASAATGYHFVNWTRDGEEVSTDAAYTFTVTEAGSYIANFEINEYEITVEANPTEGGNVTGGGTYDHGTQATLTATENSGYMFVNWTKDGQEVSTEATYVFEVTGEGNYIANFAEEVTVEVTLNNTEAGSVTGEGVYAKGQEITVSATANTGYTFVNWTVNGNEVSTDAEYTFTVEDDITLTANFEVSQYTITVVANPANGGVVTGEGVYSHGSTVEITATANEHFNFINWTKNGSLYSENATETFTATESAIYQANFAEEAAPTEFTIVAEAAEGGSIDPEGNVTVQLGANQTFTITPDEHKQIQSVNVDGVNIGVVSEYTFENVQEDHTITAYFDAAQYQVTTNVNIEGSGTVTGGGTYWYNTTITITAVASEGYEFINWTDNNGNTINEPSFDLDVTEDIVFTANFVKVWTIDVNTNNDNAGTATGSGTYHEGETVTLTATANDGFVFTGWEKDGQPINAAASFNITVNEETSGTYTANFAARYRIIVSATQGGTATGGGYYNDGTEITIHATPTTEGYVFECWKLNGECVSDEADYTFTVTGNTTFVASFIQQFVIEAIAGEGGSVSPVGANTYNKGESVTLTATPDDNYAFVGWFNENGTKVSELAEWTFTANASGTYTANFVRIFTFIVNANEGGSVNPEGEITYNAGETVTLEATPTQGYAFLNWTKDSETIDGGNIITFIASEETSGTYTANFVARYTITVDATEGGNATGGGTFNNGTEITIHATSTTEGYVFECWKLNGECVSDEADYTFTVTGNATFVATFVQQFVIKAIAGEGGTVEPEGEQTYNAGDLVTLTATPDDDHLFSNWTKDEEVVSTDAIFTFIATESATYTANFIEKSSISFTITAIAGEHGSITPQGEVTVTYGQDMTFTITPDVEYQIVSVFVDGEDMGAITEYTFEQVTGDHSIEAVFESDGVTESVEAQISLYPNPASRVINIEGDDIREVRVYSINGVLVKHETANGNTVQVNVSDLSVGLYTVQCIGLNGVTTRNFIKR